MVERITTRSSRVEGDDYIAVKRDEFTNAKGKSVVQIVEEHNISMEDIDEVLDKAVQDERIKVQEELDKKQSELDELKKDFDDSEDYAKFKEFLEREDTKKHFENFSKEKGIQTGESTIKEYEKTLADINAWEVQFKELKDEINR